MKFKLNEEFIDIDFDEFDEIVTREIVAKKSDSDSDIEDEKNHPYVGKKFQYFGKDSGSNYGKTFTVTRAYDTQDGVTVRYDSEDGHQTITAKPSEYKLLKDSKTVNEAVKGSKIKITSGSCDTKWIYDTMTEPISMYFVINNIPCEFKFSPNHGRYVVDGVDCNYVKFEGDSYYKDLTHSGGTARSYALSIPGDVLTSQPKQNQKDYRFTGQYYSTTPAIRYCKELLKELLTQHPDYFHDDILDKLGLAQSLEESYGGAFDIEDSINSEDEYSDIDVTINDDEFEDIDECDVVTECDELDECDIVPECNDIVKECDGLEECDSVQECDVVEECDVVDECSEVKECEDKAVKVKPIQKEGKSLADIYESRKNKQRNKIVEALLVDSTIETIEDSLKSILNASGISKAESIVVIGLILDRMLNANDDEVAAPEFLDSTINELVDNKDIIDVVKTAVEKALEGDEHPAPGLVDTEAIATVISSEDDQEPKVINSEGEEKKAEVAEEDSEEE